MNARKSRRKSQLRIAGEWDRIAHLRAHQIESGKDLSFTHILVPTIVLLANDTDRSSVLDAGCGIGSLSRIFARTSKRVVGVDLSQNSIHIAERLSKKDSKITFLASSIEKYSQLHCGEEFSLVVANMTLMDAPDLMGAIRAIYGQLRFGGHFIFSICHPCFWPRYWNYEDKEWFEYGEELAIEAPFKISMDQSSKALTTHFHRPLEQYLTCLAESGFKVDRVLEPMPAGRIKKMYPKEWKYPRFFFAKCSK